MKVEYFSTNSGGHWWVDDAGWERLEKTGWVVDWVRNQKKGLGGPDKDGRWLGALATSATKPNCSSILEAVKEWEAATGCDATDAGCPCCGPPHHFTLYDDNDHYVDSGPSTEYSVHW